MKKLSTILLCMGTAFSVQAGLEDLIITEIVVTPTEGEFFEIHNRGAVPLDLSNVYVTDATGSGNFYYNITTGANYGGGSSSDFHARFPSGAIIAAGEYQTVAINGVNFNGEYGVNATYELNESDGTTNMLEAVSGSINNQGGLSNAGEFLVLYHWDGISDLVADIDYVVWGDQAEAVDKTGVTIGGGTYANDTAIGSQEVIENGAHAFGSSFQRSDLTEGTETTINGNGITGNDETSENLSSTFTEGDPTPNLGIGEVPPEQFLINEIDTVSAGADFIELYGNPNVSTEDYTIVLYDGATDLSTAAISLDGMNTDGNGYLVINNELADGADAVALYIGDSSNFPVGMGISTIDIMDAVVYGSGTNDAELLTLLNAGQPQLNEDENGNAMTESLGRCSNGSGGALNTATFKAIMPPSPGFANDGCVSIIGYYDSVDDTNADTLRLTLHQIIDDHQSFPYTDSTTDTWDVLRFADEDPNPAVDLDPAVSEQVWMVYRNNSYTTENGGNSNYNREHTWPQSYGFSGSGPLGDDNTARTDAHHLMLSDIQYNSNRDANYFDYCNPAVNSDCIEMPTDDYNGQGGGSGTYPGNSNWYEDNNDGDDVFEVWDARKGDIARAMFYMDVRYDDLAADPSGIPSGEVDLILTDNASLINTNQPYMGLLSVLLEWHEFDPVDEIELLRNDEVFALQENRNPFVDHPEWVECIFVPGGTCGTVSDDIIFANGFEQ
ncbi:MAG: endonuclease [Marinicella sp.]